MKQLIKDIMSNPQSIPCLFYPAAKGINLSIREVLTDAEQQARLLAYISDRFPFGAVVRMTELWCEAASFGMDVEVTETDFPKLGSPIYAEPETMQEITVPEVRNPITEPLIEAVRMAAKTMDKPLIVGVTGPYTLGSVLNGSEDFMVNCMMEPEIIESFLEQVTDFLIRYILEYKKAGARAVMIAEPSTAMISPDMMEEFSNTYINKIISSVSDDDFAVIYHNCGDVNRHLETIAQLHADGFHFGSQVDMRKAVSLMPDDKLVMGNLEPQLFLNSSLEDIAAAKNVLTELMNGESRFKLSTGCDLSPSANLDNIRAIF